MDMAGRRRARLKQLIELAQAYKGWSRKELARVLGRDPTKLVPGSGIPKLDLVVDLANVLDWPVGTLVSTLWRQDPAQGDATLPNSDYEALDEAAKMAHRQGQYALMVDLGKQAYEAATTPEERARACNRQAGGWDGQGRFANVLEVVQQGLRENPISSDFRRMLQSNLANAYYTLWSLTEAEAIAQGLIDWYQNHPPESIRDRKTQAFAHYVSGHTLRRLISQDPDNTTIHGFRAQQHLQSSAKLYRQLARDLDDDSFAGIAHTCEGGMIEVEAALGQKEPDEALKIIIEKLDAVIDTDQENGPVGDWLESYGWWCIFGCNIALRHLTDEPTLQHHMAICTNKADEIADRLDNWSLRERAFTMQYTRWQRAKDATGFEIPQVIDRDDVRLIAGTMGRYPTFRDTGWQILQTAQVVRNN